MEFEIILSIEAVNDIEQGILYYENELAGLGVRFLNQVDSTFKKISDNPYVYALRYDVIRCAGIWKFPFLVHFTLDDISKTATIIAVYNTHRRPRWEKQAI